MNINIQSVKFDADKKLIDFTQSKLNKFERFSDKITGAEVIFKLDKDHDAGNKVVVIEVSLPGDNLVSEQRSKSFEESVDLAIDALKKQLERYKERH